MVRAIVRAIGIAIVKAMLRAMFMFSDLFKMYRVNILYV